MAIIGPVATVLCEVAPIVELAKLAGLERFISEAAAHRWRVEMGGLA